MASRPFRRLAAAARVLSLAALAGALISGVLALTQIAAAAAHPTAAPDRPARQPGASRPRALHDPLRHTPAPASCTPVYTVRPADTLSAIAVRCYGTPAAWTVLYHANQAILTDPDLIYPGQHLKVPPRPAILTLTPLTPQTTRPAAAPTHTTAHTTAVTHAYDITHGCASLEHLWQQAGGSPAAARTAASIAVAESGGTPSATLLTGGRTV